MDRREFPCEFKAFGETSGAGAFEGVASVFGNVDRQGDIIVKGAFRNLDAFVRDGFIASAHDWSEPIGIIDKAFETSEGLVVSGRFHSTKRAQETRAIVNERLADGKSVAMSIGFQINDQDFKDGIRTLSDVELFEVSIVTVPANPLARMTAVKSIDDAELEARRIVMRRLYLDALALRRV